MLDAATGLHHRGDPVVWRDVVPPEWGGQPAHAGFTYGAVVVEDHADASVLWIPVGSPVRVRTGERGPDGRNLMPGGWDGAHSAREWHDAGVLRAHPTGAPWSVWRWREAWGEGAGDRWSDVWYVNLEQPWRRTAQGFDSHDTVLDLLVWRDPFRTEWKDEHELAWCVEAGVVSAELAHAVHADGAVALAAAAAGVWPFSVDWDRWLPDASWPVPELPDGWDAVAG